MSNQIYWENISVGDEIPPLAKIATTQMLAKWAGASGDFVPLHYDDAFARSQGLSGVIIHGALQRQWLVQMLTNWIGSEGTLNKFSCQYRAVDYPRTMKTLTEPQDGDTWWCRGRVTAKQMENTDHYIDCELRVENGRGEVITSGRATVTLPSRAS